jgi:uncharacterized membrane protein
VRQVWGTVGERWYVTIFGLVFLWRASRHLGWKHTLIFAVAAVGFGALVENASVHWGFPYTKYSFNEDLRGDELFIGDVPLMVPMSYTFMAYFAFAGGRLLASGPWRTRGRALWHEYLLGIVLAVWVVWILDPVSRLGDRFFLGELFRYDGPGFWFGLPLASQAGFLLTAGVLITYLTYLTRREPDRPVGRWIHHPHLTSLITWHGQLVMMTAVAVHLGAVELGGSAVLMWIPAAAITAVYWSVLRPPRQPDQSAADATAEPIRDRIPTA